MHKGHPLAYGWVFIVIALKFSATHAAGKGGSEQHQRRLHNHTRDHTQPVLRFNRGTRFSPGLLCYTPYRMDLPE